ncbi:DNA-binding domain-containing protein [Acidaminobacter hydrogenoformans]|uniref:Stage 0 sporulation protein A homolog n=1 Tax=Acidaminobacter hydrogenoformans DSM 2784 TaxID=1120920 RepID=A0A1G5RX56_9FIRM|nr:DNA-binding domain-containing protein [Acidaminobacter hydrogenoformans]SCZ78715.1 two-component system, response regulator YcbB [Acidaminobacter hydrogenoformans DSM 2784]
MRIYIVEDDSNVIKYLSHIIVDCDLGEVVGIAQNGAAAYDEILMLKPDLVLVDLLMPGKDGITLVQDIKKVNSRVQFVMISQVSSKEMIGRAYQSGVEYYISKPVNAIETQSVIKKVKEKISIYNTLNQIQSIFSSGTEPAAETPRDSREDEIRRIFQKIGIVGEVGSQDIQRVVLYLLDSGKGMADFTVKEICGKFTDQTKSMEQRIRRTATVGMTNLAHMGIEDYMNETLNELGNGLYSYEQIKIEMDYIRGKTKKRGKVNLRKFIDGMVSFCKVNK